jgi:acylglycerol lipase
MNHIEGTFRNVRNLNIYYQGWTPDGDVKAVLFLVHGLGEHSGRYANVVNHYVPLGYAVYGIDLIGHGKSEGEREMVKRFEDFTEPIETFYKMVVGWQPGKPIFMYGHSLGGLIAAYYLLDHQEDFKGAIISGPLAKIPDNITPMTVLLSKILVAIAPKMGMIGLDTNYLSHDRTVVDSYNADPLVFHGKTPIKLTIETLNGMIRASSEMNRITLPAFILHGSLDKIVDPSSSQMVFEKIGSQDKTLKMYEGMYHEVHNEPDRDVMFNDLDKWLQAKWN